MAGAAEALRHEDIGAEEFLRADLYGLLATLLATAPSADTLARAATLSGDGSDLGRAITALAAISSRTTEGAAEREYNALFIGLSRGELLPYASYYLTGFLNEKPLAVLRGHLAALGVEKAEGVFEPEDHMATLCATMSGLIRGDFGAPLALSEQNAFFNTHLAPWAGHFFSDLEAAKNAVLYAPVGSIGRAFMDIEIDAFRMEGTA